MRVGNLFGRLPTYAARFGLQVALVVGCADSNGFRGIAPTDGSTSALPDGGGAPDVQMVVKPPSPDVRRDVEVSGPDMGPDLVPETPPRLRITGSTPTPLRGGDGGEPQWDNCPDDQVLVGLRGTRGNLQPGIDIVMSVQGECGRLLATGGPPYLVTTVRGTPLPIRGEPATQPFATLCPSNQVVVAIAGRYGTFVDRLQVQCAPLSVAGSPTPAVVIGKPAPLQPDDTAQPNPFHDTCPPGQIARGHATRDGDWLDALGLLCGTPTAVP